MVAITQQLEQARRVFRENAGILRAGQALAAGIHPRTLYAMRDSGLLETLGRGLYRLADLPPLGNPDLVTVAARVPAGIICLISALAHHEITTQIPHEVWVALPKGAERPRLEYPPIRPVWLRGEAYSEGIERHRLDGVDVKVYSLEKTLADCFRFRNQLGLDVCLEALKLYRQRKKMRVDDLLRYARIGRIEKIMRPYLEAVL